MKKLFFYIILCCVNSIISMIDLYIKVKDSNIFLSSLNHDEKKENILLPIYSSFSLWMCGINAGKYAAVFFYVNLAVIILFCLIFSKTVKSEISERKTIPKHSSGKYIKAFGLSGLLSVIPLILNFLTISMFVSSIRPDSVYDVFYGIFSDNIFGDVFYRFPFLYLLIFIALVFTFWGAIGCIGYSLTVIIRKKIIPLTFMGGTLLIIHYIQYRSKSEKVFSPLSLFCSYRCLYENYTIICIELIILIGLALFLALYSLRQIKLSEDIKE